MNKELLLKTVKFPLDWDCDEYKMYIFDADMEMIAQVSKNLDATRNKHPFEKLVGGYKEPKANYGMYKLVAGRFINTLTLESIGLVRGWGGITSKLLRKKHKNWEEEAIEVQDNIAEYILNVINGE